MYKVRLCCLNDINLLSLMKRFSVLIFAILFGALSVLGWTPFDWWPISLLGFAALFLLLSSSNTVLHAASVGFAFGFGLHGAGHGWVLNSLHSKAGLSLVPAVFSTVIFVTYLALYSAVPCLLWRIVVPHRSLSCLSDVAACQKKSDLFVWYGALAAFSSLLTLGEWARSLFFNGFTSLSLGYGLVDTWLAGYAPVMGLYGVSWLGYYIAGLVMLMLWHRNSRPISAVLLMVIIGIGFGLDRYNWVQPSGAPLSYRLIQSNVAQERKFDPLYGRQQMQQLVETIERQRADMIITPETAFTMFFNELPGDTLSRLQKFSARTGSHLFLGMGTSAASGAGYNSMIQITPDETGITRYDKVRLMPFGEYSPNGFGWFTSLLSIPLKDLSPGSVDQPPFIVGEQRIGASICHEDLVGENTRRWLPAVGIIMNPSNLAWFQGSLAIGQFLQITRMRALESGRPILRVSNTGITAHIAHRGNVISSLPETVEGTLTGYVQPMQGDTPYARWGDWLVVIGCSMNLLFMWLTIRWRNCESIAPEST